MVALLIVVPTALPIIPALVFPAPYMVFLTLNVQGVFMKVGLAVVFY